MRKVYDRADWAKIGERVTQQMGPWKEIRTRPALDAIMERLTEVTAQAIDQFTPNSRPSPYAKRWFTQDLKA